MGCCANPDPRILEKNGRLYCHSCRRYLDKKEDGTTDAIKRQVLTQQEKEKR